MTRIPEQVGWRAGRRALAAAVCAWVLAISATTAQLWQFKSTAGAQCDAPPHWPRASGVPLDGSRFTVLVFAHPHCPCTAATLSECRRLAAASERLCVHVVFAVPGDATADFRDGPNVHTARSIPGVEVFTDEGCKETARFGALTSGMLVAYSPQGQLVYQGGITELRGHAGTGQGAETILDAAAGQQPAVHSSPVFGCPLDRSGCP